jgi:hypothetical protein
LKEFCKFYKGNKKSEKENEKELKKRIKWPGETI